MLFAMRIEPWIRPLLLLFSATSARSYVEVNDDTVGVRFGFWYETIPRSEIDRVEPHRPQWYASFGWRWWPGHVLLLGSHRGVVTFILRRSRRVQLVPLLPRIVPVTRISISMRDPDAVLAALAPAQG